MFFDLFAFLSSIAGFPDASEGRKIKLTRTYVNFGLLFLRSFCPKLLGYILKSGNLIKCVKKANIFGDMAHKKCSFDLQKKYGRQVQFSLTPKL